MQKALKISLLGLIVETIGLILDVLHHLSIGIKTPEGLITWQHTVVFIGFAITAVGILKIYQSTRN